ncbi:hypothetical protein ABK905_24675 [Acerihabitans sp. KWT182]|uniref:Uncharacterized protein n=1 Tax=Acerihabitans sp. KWT182 TaxID=3157919 RepID=A0AAU7Q9B9_9GAMM
MPTSISSSNAGTNINNNDFSQDLCNKNKLKISLNGASSCPHTFKNSIESAVGSSQINFPKGIQEITTEITATRFLIFPIIISDDPYCCFIIAKETNKESSQYSLLKDMETSLREHGPFFKKDKENYIKQFSKFEDLLKRPVTINKDNSQDERATIAAIDDDARCKELKYWKYPNSNSLDLSLDEGLNPNFIEALTSENQFIEFMGAVGFFNRKENAIIFSFLMERL